ncbi:MAG: hypothetical protein ACFNWZ_01975 [Candidatus Absconditicoccaceae bacterium]
MGKIITSTLLCVLLILYGCGIREIGKISLKSSGDDMKVPINNGKITKIGVISGINSAITEPTIQKVDLDARDKILITRKITTDSHQMANYFGFYDAFGSHLDYPGKKQNLFSCLTNNNKIEPNCQWYTVRYPPFSFTFKATNQVPVVEVESGGLIIKTQALNFYLEKYHYSSLESLYTDIEKYFNTYQDVCFRGKQEQKFYGMKDKTTYPVALKKDGDNYYQIFDHNHDSENFNLIDDTPFSGEKIVGWTAGLGVKLNKMFSEGKIEIVPFNVKWENECLNSKWGIGLVFKDENILYVITSDIKGRLFFYTGIYETAFSVDIE